MARLAAHVRSHDGARAGTLMDAAWWGVCEYWSGVELAQDDSR